jgi:hypothetical protein
MKMNRWLAAMATAIVVGLVFVAPAPAYASDSCAFGSSACFYKHANFPSGGPRRVVSFGTDNSNYTILTWPDGSTFNDSLTSLQGHDSGAICLSTHINYTGNGLCLLAGVWPANLGVYSFNDIASSHIWS